MATGTAFAMSNAARERQIQVPEAGFPDFRRVSARCALVSKRPKTGRKRKVAACGAATGLSSGPKRRARFARKPSRGPWRGRGGRKSRPSAARRRTCCRGGPFRLLPTARSSRGRHACLFSAGAKRAGAAASFRRWWERGPGNSVGTLPCLKFAPDVGYGTGSEHGGVSFRAFCR